MIRNTAMMALVLATALGACSSSSETATGPGTMVLATGKSLVGRLWDGGTPPEKATDLEIAAAALAKSETPMMLANLDDGPTFLISRTDRNGPISTYLSSSYQSASFEQGLLHATRGFGRDMMSAQANALLPAILRASAEPVTGTHVFRYLDGESVEQELRLTCTVRNAGPQQLALLGQSVPTTQIVEHCDMGDNTYVENLYWVTSGRILSARQWVAPGAPHLVTRVLRFE